MACEISHFFCHISLTRKFMTNWHLSFATVIVSFFPISYHYSDHTWAWWRPKSVATQEFVHQFTLVISNNAANVQLVTSCRLTSQTSSVYTLPSASSLYSQSPQGAGLCMTYKWQHSLDLGHRLTIEFCNILDSSKLLAHDLWLQAYICKGQSTY